ncbi:hypothetical protein AVEN_18177-1 [Araneus ventricosus]|uniref:Uncharacterized protein n=1 Tax=Araneus ventricosus TaxID=182803 RepID=A0A4Y2AID9_ARAVE|nr:hypothetical protein AVEN_18177-1 [Araneus ventricosus]
MATANTDAMERFAFDVFVYTMSRFNTITNIPPPKCSENTYGLPDFLLVLSRRCIALQLMKRDTWKPKFEAKFKSNELKKFKQISELLEELLKEMDRKPIRSIERTVTSLALINDLIQFLYSKNRRLFVNNLASLWRNYFACFEEEFEKEGGFLRLYLFRIEAFQGFDGIIDYFIPKYCLPYGRGEVSALFSTIYLYPSFMDSLKAVDNVRITALASSLREKLSIASRFPKRSGDKETKTSGSLENTGLGIPPHEELLQAPHSLSADKGTSAEKFIEETSATAHADVKLQRKQSGQTSREQVNGRRKSSTQITSPEGRSKDRGGLTRSPLSPEGPLKYLSALTGLSLSPRGRSEDQGALTGSSLGPQGQSKGHGALAVSPSPQEQKHRRGSPRTPEGISRLEQKRQKHRQLKKAEPTN